jgi:hypothetical protein
MKIMLLFELKEKTLGINPPINFNPSSKSQQLNSDEQLNLYFRLPTHLDQLLDQPFNQARSTQIDRWLAYLAVEEVEP